MKIEQLEQLIKTVECGSMNEAAQALYVARSSLSTSMKRWRRNSASQSSAVTARA